MAETFAKFYNSLMNNIRMNVKINWMHTYPSLISFSMPIIIALGDLTLGFCYTKPVNICPTNTSKNNLWKIQALKMNSLILSRRLMLSRGKVVH